MFELTAWTSFRLPLFAKQVLRLTSVENVCVSMPALGDQPRLVLGGGSNLVVWDARFDGVVIRPEIKGMQSRIDGDSVLLDVGAGESWHHLVMSSLAAGWYGLENLALIPGWVGAAPVQNIGAYGAEFGEFCESVLLYDFEEHGLVRLSRAEMQFGYRHSILKTHPERFLVLSVQLRLSRLANPRIGYGAIGDTLSALGGSPDCPADIAHAVMAIRSAKLPDPEVLPNVGSFFKNPVVRVEVAERLRQQCPELPMYPDHSQYKLAAGWMIDALGFKGKRVGGFQVHSQQALVIINDQGGTPEDLAQLVREIRTAVFERFGVRLQIEPTQVGRLAAA